VPKLWSDTVDAHRREVGDAILDTTASLVFEHGLHGVTMSEIAKKAGIGRATLYKYFPDVEAILTAWHERHVAAHLADLTALRTGTGDPVTRLVAVLEGYAFIQQQSHDNEVAALLHRGPHVARAHQHLKKLVRDLVAEGASSGQLRDDVPPNELASYCLHALSAASRMQSKSAVSRLVGVTVSGMRRAHK
jgi:AcrR family transcriptional regulator